ncbi:MAG: hypothetical protein ACPGCP_06480, partial [Candidatus Nanopelagicales bacterium]
MTRAEATITCRIRTKASDIAQGAFRNCCDVLVVELHDLHVLPKKARDLRCEEDGAMSQVGTADRTTTERLSPFEFRATFRTVPAPVAQRIE